MTVHQGRTFCPCLVMIIYSVVWLFFSIYASRFHSHVHRVDQDFRAIQVKATTCHRVSSLISAQISSSTDGCGRRWWGGRWRRPLRVLFQLVPCRTASHVLARSHSQCHLLTRIEALPCRSPYCKAGPSLWLLKREHSRVRGSKQAVGSLPQDHEMWREDHSHSIPDAMQQICRATV